ncbi:1,4-alpha-glucan branching protein [Streptomyces abyssalis]|uniref:1,4-alpha-glucan branching protein n=1 Tax=Streptomyces abyssalis TaxID=933944 RepID=A0A1E7JJB3_9ACTN|nr:1,4-alpha-glucan branching protein [Streptomyces abyssalis]OEU87178.1 1,4-alpha-glucan branching protein [Streptomyces abyssalis]OEU87712.1 1,4-alpha-glucan branching protein [Streptomyces abyssalis]OEV26718.1 1,4-alpha-glucan branching protein [Streptomyces nanshensis]
MATIHHSTVKPTKLELLTTWLPSRPWYRGGAGKPELTKAGGFRLDDPEGEVGIEFMVVTDSAGAAPVTYLVPLTYRGAPLGGADHALIGTMEHGVLGRRWAYDGCHDPVLVGQLIALIEGRAEAQAQSISDTPDPEVTRSGTGEEMHADLTAAPAAIDDQEGTELAVAHGGTLRLHRILQPAPEDPPQLRQGASGHVAGHWQMPDGTRARALFAVLHAEPRA